MVKKQKKITYPLDEVVIETDVDNSGKSQYALRHYDTDFSSTQWDSPVMSTFKATGSLGGNMETIHVDTTINLGDHS